MSSLNEVDKRCLEKILCMGSGYVLDFNDATFGDFFHRHGVDIHSDIYQTYGTSKANKMRSFWDREHDAMVATVVSEMIDIYEANCDLGDMTMDTQLLTRARSIVSRLSGESEDIRLTEVNKQSLQREFAGSIGSLPIEQKIVPIIESRLAEVDRTLGAGAYLSSVVMCGSILEAVLLGKAKQEPARFNGSKKAPKTTAGEVKRFGEWKLADLIDVASDLDILKPDVHKFGHFLRDFRNYIHPDQQMKSGFMPDEHTAEMCVQVLRAALARIAEEVKHLTGARTWRR